MIRIVLSGPGIGLSLSHPFASYFDSAHPIGPSPIGSIISSLCLCSIDALFWYFEEVDPNENDQVRSGCAVGVLGWAWAAVKTP